MLTVSTLLSNPLFQDFRIIAGRSGLDNAILSTGYFEWEQDSDIVRSFGKSEFVITTLYAAQNDMGFAEKCLKLLINNHVAAIAIKDVYYQDLSDEIKNYADEHSVPILVFSNTYIDDIIVTIHNGLTGSLSASHSNSVLDRIIFDASLTAQDREGLMRRLNSFLCSSTIFAAYISEDIDTPNLTAASISQYEAIYDVIKNDVPREIDGTVFVPLFAAYKRGFFLIYTCDTMDAALTESFHHALCEKIFSQEIFQNHRIGIGTRIHGFKTIPNLLLEAIYANTSGILNKKQLTVFSEMAPDSLIFPFCDTPYYTDYYRSFRKILSDAGNNSTLLLDTLLVFVANGGNMDLTAKALFQHKNTIRYRINKISTLLDIDNDMELYHELYLFSRIHEARKYLNMFFKD